MKVKRKREEKFASVRPFFKTKTTVLMMLMKVQEVRMAGETDGRDVGFNRPIDLNDGHLTAS